MIASQEIGLADWHTHRHTDGTQTLLRQSVTRLALISDRGADGVFWRLYTDPHGMVRARTGQTKTVAFAQVLCDRWLDGSNVYV